MQNSFYNNFGAEVRTFDSHREAPVIKNWYFQEFTTPHAHSSTKITEILDQKYKFGKQFKKPQRETA